jgi:hypothetical protein
MSNQTDNINIMNHPSFYQNRDSVVIENRSIAQIENDRTTLLDAESRKDYPLTSSENYNTPYRNVLSGIQELNPFSRMFFSVENIKWLQSNIRYKVYTYSDSKHIISNQDEANLIIVMRAMYLQYSNNPSCKKDYRGEILRINNLVLGKIVPDIITELEQYKGYLRDIEKNPEPIPLPQNVSITGTRGSYGRSPADVLGINTLG